MTMKPKPVQTRTSKCYSLPNWLVRDLEEMSTNLMVTNSSIVETALIEFFGKSEEKKDG